MKIFEKGIVQLVCLVLVALLFLAARLGPHKTWPQKSDCFDMGTGTTACLAKSLAKNLLKVIPLMKYVPDGQRGDPQSALAKYNLAPYIAALTDLVESFYSNRPTGEAFSKAAGTFIGDQVVSHGTKPLFRGWKIWGFRSGSIIGAYFGGKVGVMAYDLYSLYNSIFHGRGNSVASSVHKEL
ncbi:uncharacterized protein LOC110414192 [Herrania umbratica]|uniref:Uncharacterized protein LOC110414192 n=1 Tax=Herrania umbratica TaxID=108875 RepID=A0A6J1A2E8_9ROSI|nr:uncharacterized protein LOC110414192 [Herrania umbratica]